MHKSRFLSTFATIRLCLVLLFAIPTLTALADTDYRVLSEKASRFYEHKEWASALAMYELMLMQRPGDTETYGLAIIVNGINGKPNEQMRLIEQTQLNGIAMDDIFHIVKKESFALGKPQIYENLLTTVKARQPWMRRSIDIRLIDFYEKRNNAPKMIELSDSLLALNPGDNAILQVKARGLMLEDRPKEAIYTYKQILATDSTCMDALLSIGTYYHEIATRQNLHPDSPEAKEARNYLSKAYAIRRNPHIAQLLSDLSK